MNWLGGGGGKEKILVYQNDFSEEEKRYGEKNVSRLIYKLNVFLERSKIRILLFILEKVHPILLS